MDSLLAWLRARGADCIPHSGGTLYGHLTRTCLHVVRWGASAHVVRGALFHSVYGTRSFRHRLLSHEERPIVRSLIGGDAEQLVFLFSTLDRKKIFSEGNKVPPVCRPERVLRELAIIELANLADQVASPQPPTSVHANTSTRVLLAHIQFLYGASRTDAAASDVSWQR
ncbi:DUF6817 domain-containing protein [Bradyrhizobium japonicum]|uniref:DUF6817 domain-containing protein n=1 Tax=Bradyrhizobium japonicum TaxID=375 RepID=UPI003D9BF0EE